MVGSYLSDRFIYDNIFKKILFCLILFFFGGIIALLDFISPKIFDSFEYITDEIRFQYRILFTDYFDNIYLDDKYSIFYESREKKLKRTEELAQNSSKQMQRHNKQIQNKYGTRRS